MKVEARGGQHVFEVQVFLSDLDPEAVRVELYATVSRAVLPMRQQMKRVCQLADTPGGYVYRTAVSADRPAADYTARVIPHCDGVAVPLEASQILWQR
jgi:starch phosphorylase